MYVASTILNKTIRIIFVMENVHSILGNKSFYLPTFPKIDYWYKNLLDIVRKAGSILLKFLHYDVSEYAIFVTSVYKLYSKRRSERQVKKLYDKDINYDNLEVQFQTISQSV